MGRPSRRALKRVTSDALLVRSVPYGESDLVIQLLTETDGRLGAIVRGGRKSTKRVGGALEPFHTIRVELEDKGRELATLKEARLSRIRTGIGQSLEALDAAGAALRWARQLCPPRTPEPAAWATLTHLLDALDAGVAHPKVELAAAALRLLADVGYALDLDRCVGCGKPRPPGRPAYVDAARGGIVCTSCGGSRRLVDAELLDVARAAQAGDASRLTHAHAAVLLELVEEAMGAHAGIEA
jgi:DNA repair protein RecO (recombination protein O)